MTAPIAAEPPRRRRAPWEPTSWCGKGMCWVLSPVLDPHDNYPSGPRLMAWAIAAGALLGHEMSSPLAAILLATMWGYSAWKAQQEKTTLALSGTGSVAVNYAKNISRTFTESVSRVFAARDPEKGIDPSRPEHDASGGAE